MSAPQGEAMARLASCGQEKARIDADREKSRRIGAGSVCQRGRGIALARPYAVRRNKKTPVRVFIVLVAGAGFEPTTF
ncbi:TPA: hypothetical protein ACHOZB_004102, partial [Raoultella planticola]